METADFIRALAAALSTNDRTMSMREVASLLNKVGYRTTYRAPYQGKRGTFRLIKTIVDRVRADDPEEAQRIAECFTNDDGTLAFRR